MADTKPEQQAGGTFEDPNREAVGLEPCWAEGFGGEPGAGPAATKDKAETKPKAKDAPAKAKGKD